MLDLDAKIRAQVDKRLRDEVIVWFTTVSPSGVPTPNPVWFLWDGEHITVYSQPSSYRVRNIKQNSNVALTLQGVDATGHNVLIVSGEAILQPGIKAIPSAYWDKYAKYMEEMTQEEMTREYSVEIRIAPTKIRVE
jgi:PPOX class probable F420-dependent enzyme